MEIGKTDTFRPEHNINAEKAHCRHWVYRNVSNDSQNWRVTQIAEVTLFHIFLYIIYIIMLLENG